MIHVVIKYRCLFLDCLTPKDGSIQCWEMSGNTHPVTCNILEDWKSYQRLLSITHHISTFLSPSSLIIYTVASLCSRYVTTTPNKRIYILSLISSTLNVLQTLASLIFWFKFFHTYSRFFPHIHHTCICCVQTVKIFTLCRSSVVCLLYATILTTGL